MSKLSPDKEVPHRDLEEQYGFDAMMVDAGDVSYQQTNVAQELTINDKRQVNVTEQHAHMTIVNPNPTDAFILHEHAAQPRVAQERQKATAEAIAEHSRIIGQYEAAAQQLKTTTNKRCHF